MEISKLVSLPRWDGEQRRRAIQFWMDRGFRFRQADSDPLVARRGSLWGNLTSYDMGKLAATLTIECKSPDAIECVMVVNTVFQDITEWNQAYWQLEMESFESWLLHGDKKEAEWSEFLNGSRRAAIEWTLSCGRFGRKMPGSGGQDGQSLL